MLISVLLAQAFIMGVLSVLVIGLALGLYGVLTGRIPILTKEPQPAVGWDKVPSVLRGGAKR